MSTTPKWHSIELYITTRISTLTYRYGVSFYIIIVIIARWLCTSIHNIVFVSLTLICIINPVSYTHLTLPTN